MSANNSYLDEQGLIVFWQKIKERFDTVLPSSAGVPGTYLTYGAGDIKTWKDIPGVSSNEIASIVSGSLAEYGFLGTPGQGDLWTKITTRYNE